MPQLDFTIAFPQIFWLVIIFFSLYIFLVHFFLPSFIKSLKTRKHVITENLKRLLKLEIKFNSKQSSLNQILENNFLKIKVLLEKNVSIFFKTSYLFDLELVDKKISKALYNNVIYYNTNVIESIPIKPVFQN